MKLAVIGTIVAVALVATWTLRGGEPELRFTEDVPPDVQQLAAATWDEFTDFFSQRTGCFPDVTVDVAWAEYPVRAEYLPDHDRVVLRIPATAPRLRTSLLHELGHHLEAHCVPLQGMTTALRVAQGLAADAPWYEAEYWALTPSEHFAETVAETIAGFRTNNLDLIVVSPEAKDALMQWAGAEDWRPREGWSLPDADS